MVTTFRKLAVFGVAASVAASMSGCAWKSHEHDDLAARLSALEKRGVGTTVIQQAAPAPAAAPAAGPRRASRLSAVPAGYKGAYMALPTGDEATSALLIEKMVPESVTAGAEYEYYILVTNLSSNLDLKNVTVTDKFDSGFTFASSTPSPASANGGVLTFNFASLGPGAQEKITVKGSATGTGSVVSCAEATYVPVLCLGTEAEKPAIDVTLAGPDAIQVCDIITYTGTVKNTGTGTAKDVVLKKVLSAGVTPVDGSMEIRIGDLAAGESKDYSYQARVEKGGSYTALTEAASGNVQTVNSTTVATNACKPEASCAIDGIGKIFVGRQHTYTITVTNPSSCVAKNVAATTTLSSGLSFVSATEGGSASGSTVTWSLGDLAAGSSKTLTLTLSGTTIGNNNLTTKITGECVETSTCTKDIEVAGIPAILLEVVDETDPVPVGGETVYVITATNQGSAVGTNVKITATVDAGQEIAGLAGDTQGTQAGATVTFAPLASLAVGAKATWRVTVKATAAGDKRFKVEMISDQLTRSVDETESTNLYE